MERLTRFPWGPLSTSTAVSGAALVGILGFGAPPVILLPVSLVGLTLYLCMVSYVDRRFER